MLIFNAESCLVDLSIAYMAFGGLSGTFCTAEENVRWSIGICTKNCLDVAAWPNLDLSCNITMIGISV